MGTNYYVADNPCEHCGRSDGGYHIGKSGRIVRAYIEDDPTPWGVTSSWQDWKRIVQLPDVQITDEYGRVLTPDELITIFETTPLEERRRQYDLIQRSYPSYAGWYWLDDDGFTVYDGEFS